MTTPKLCPETVRQKLERWLGVGSEDHRQLYWAWRVFPRAMIKTLMLGYGVGGCVTAALFMIVRGV